MSTISGKIATHLQKPYWATITVDQTTGLIQHVKKGKDPHADHVFSSNHLIFPGMGDIHIHAREDETKEQCHKEDYQSAADAALSGGCVHVCAMPNTPNPVTTKARFNWHRKRIEQLGHDATILNYVGIDKNTKPLGKPGEHMYKLYFGKSVGDLTVTYASELDTILGRYKKHNISFHVEYEPVVQNHADGKTHSDRRPVTCVNEGLRLLLPLIEKYQINAKLCHWSTGGESFSLIREYQKRGCSIVLEVSPLHLLFDTEMTKKDPSLWLKIQMNPAIQSSQHRKALIRGLKTGFIQFLATDHAPHTKEEKYGAFAKFQSQYPKLTNVEIAGRIKTKSKKTFVETCQENGMSGAPWLDTFGLVCVFLMREQSFSPQTIARVAAYNPAQFVNPFLKKQSAGWREKPNFGKGFGEIKKDFIGSFTVLNTKDPFTLKATDLKTKPAWSPLEGRTFKGHVEAVFVRGKRVVGE